AYYAAQLLTKEWLQPVSEQHEMFPVTTKETKNGAHGLPVVASAKAWVPGRVVTAYAVRRPDKQWALIAINKDPKRGAQLNVEFNLSSHKQRLILVGEFDITQPARRQPAWQKKGQTAHPTPTLPPVKIPRKAPPIYDLPPYSLTILRGNVAE